MLSTGYLNKDYEDDDLKVLPTTRPENPSTIELKEINEQQNT